MYTFISKGCYNFDKVLEVMFLKFLVLVRKSAMSDELFYKLGFSYESDTKEFISNLKRKYPDAVCAVTGYFPDEVTDFLNLVRGTEFVDKEWFS